MHGISPNKPTYLGASQIGEKKAQHVGVWSENRSSGQVDSSTRSYKSMQIHKGLTQPTGGVITTIH